MYAIDTVDSYGFTQNTTATNSGYVSIVDKRDDDNARYSFFNQIKSFLSVSARSQRKVDIENNGHYLLLVSNDISTDITSADVLTVADMIDAIRSAFGLNHAQLARLLKISRPTLYKHMKDGNPPVEIYNDLYSLAQAVRNSSLTGGFQKGLRSVVVDGDTLLGHLGSTKIDNDTIIKLCGRIEEKLASNENDVTIDVEDMRAKTSVYTTLG